MAQQINLYHAGLRRPRQWAAQQALLCLAGVLLLSALAGAGLDWHGRHLAQQAQAAEALLAQRQAQLQALRDGRVPLPRPAASQAATEGLQPPHNLAELEREVQGLRQQAAAQQHLRALLDAGTAGRLIGYSNHLLALARQARGQVWITGLRLDASGAPTELEGRLRDPAALPDYLRHLSEEKEFLGRSFAQLQLRRLSAEVDGAAAFGDFSEFSLRSQVGPGLPAAPSAPQPPVALPPPAAAATTTAGLARPVP